MARIAHAEQPSETSGSSRWPAQQIARATLGKKVQQCRTHRSLPRSSVRTLCQTESSCCSQVQFTCKSHSQFPPRASASRHSLSKCISVRCAQIAFNRGVEAAPVMQASRARSFGHQAGGHRSGAGMAFTQQRAGCIGGLPRQGSPAVALVSLHSQWHPRTVATCAL